MLYKLDDVYGTLLCEDDLAHYTMLTRRRSVYINSIAESINLK